MRELKRMFIPLEVDRNVAPDTSVGLWITPGVNERLKASTDRKVRCCHAQPPRATQTHARSHPRARHLLNGPSDAPPPIA
eukprot:206471-Prymnesium_polylepis.1